MSRSYRRSPHGNACSGNNKFARSLANRRLRRANDSLLRRDGEDFEGKILREVSNVWCFPTDGLGGYYGDSVLENRILSICSEISELVNRGRRMYGIFGWSRCYAPEGILDFFGLPLDVGSFDSVTNDMIREYANYLCKRENSR